MPERLQYAQLSGTRVYLDCDDQTYAVPLYASRVSAGLPTLAEDYCDQTLELDKKLIKHPQSTFLVMASGDSMINANIQSGDILVVDRNIAPKEGSIVIAAIDGELTVKRLSLTEGHLQLLPENPAYKPILITLEQNVILWGVVILVIAKGLH